MAAALSDMLLYFGVRVVSNVTKNPQFLHPPHEQGKVLKVRHFPKMAATVLFVPISHKQCNYMISI